MAYMQLDVKRSAPATTHSVRPCAQMSRTGGREGTGHGRLRADGDRPAQDRLQKAPTAPEGDSQALPLTLAPHPLTMGKPKMPNRKLNNPGCSVREAEMQRR